MDIDIEGLLTEVEGDLNNERRARAKKNLIAAYRAREQAVQVLENIENDIEAMKLDIAAGGDGSFGKR